MAIRNDITIDWEDSPRIIQIAQPSVTITVQDLHDTLVSIQDSIEGSEFPDLVASSGKGGGVTGIVTILQNAEVLFEPRTTKIETGTITTPDTAGRTLIDSTALFVTNGVARGDMAVNTTDGSHATVQEVVSETELKTLVLAGGIDNQYDSADSYEIFDYVLASITGGDLFAVDDLGADIDPILNSFGVFGPIVEQSTSPAAVPVQPNTVLENGITWEQAMFAVLAAAAGKSDGFDGVAGSGVRHFRDQADSKNRITVTSDEFGNRTAITLDLT